MEISKMTLADFEEISSVLQTEFDKFWNKNILESELKKENTYYIVSRNGGEITGFAGMLIGIDALEIMNIVVREKNRKQGIGEALLNELIKISKELKLKEPGLEYITLEVNEKNMPARKLYEKLGFKEVRM